MDICGKKKHIMFYRKTHVNCKVYKEEEKVHLKQWYRRKNGIWSSAVEYYWLRNKKHLLTNDKASTCTHSLMILECMHIIMTRLEEILNFTLIQFGSTFACRSPNNIIHANYKNINIMLSHIIHLLCSYSSTFVLTK